MILSNVYMWKRDMLTDTQLVSMYDQLTSDNGQAMMMSMLMQGVQAFNQGKQPVLSDLKLHPVDHDDHDGM